MSRNRYEAGHGVARLRWQFGEPRTTAHPVVVEVWRSDLDAGECSRPELPRVRVRATIEVRYWNEADKRWMTFGYRGEAKPSVPGTIRRWAELPMRWWHANLTIDGWTPDRGES